MVFDTHHRSARRWAVVHESTIPAPGEPAEGGIHPRVDVGPGGPRYRGHRAVSLAEAGVPFEGVAELLWTGAEPRRAWWPSSMTPGPTLRRLPPVPDVGATLRFALTALAIDDPHRDDIGFKDDLARARQVVPLLAAAVGGAFERRRIGLALQGRTVAERLVVALGGRAEDAPLVDRALVLCADHTGSPADEAVGAAAAAGADLYGCLGVGVATPRGNRTGMQCREIEAFVESVGSPRWAPDVVGDVLLKGATVPGFGHPRYPTGDPRAMALLHMAQQRAPESEALRTMQAIAASMAAAGEPAPRLAFGLAAMTRALGLDAGAGAALFAIGRLAGRVARVAERRPPRSPATDARIVALP